MTVGEDEREKTRKLNDWIHNGNRLYQKLNEQRALDGEMKKKQQHNDCMSMVQLQLQWHEHERDRKKLEDALER